MLTACSVCFGSGYTTGGLACPCGCKPFGTTNMVVQDTPVLEEVKKILAEYIGPGGVIEAVKALVASHKEDVETISKFMDELRLDEEELERDSKIIYMLADSLCHCNRVFMSMAERGAYPLELLPGQKEYLGIQGFQFINDALSLLESDE